MITLLVSDKIPIEKGNYECILGKFLLTASKKSPDIPNFTVIINSIIATKMPNLCYSCF